MFLYKHLTILPYGISYKPNPEKNKKIVSAIQYTAYKIVGHTKDQSSLNLQRVSIKSNVKALKNFGKLIIYFISNVFNQSTKISHYFGPNNLIS